jgi:Cu+-exporting ATPase
MVTGESMPVHKKVGDSVIGGTVNQNGVIHIRVVKTSSEGVLASIYKLVEEAQVSKTEVQRIADKIASYFVPFIMVLAAFTFTLWFVLAYMNWLPESFRPTIGAFPFALMFAMTVLVISCPCAISLAAPTAIMVTTGLAAKLGILFKSAQVIENMHRVTTVVFDKTGTLTQGKPEVTDCIVFEPEYSEQQFLHVVASAETGFKNHVIGQSIINFASKKNVQSLVRVGRPLRGTTLLGGCARADTRAHGTRAAFPIGWPVTCSCRDIYTTCFGTAFNLARPRA